MKSILFCTVWVAAAAVSAAPTTRPAGLNQETPKAAVKLFTWSIQAGDATVVRDCLYAASAIEEQFAQGYVDVSLAIARMRRAIGARFGPDAMKAMGATDSVDEELKRIDSADQRIQGNTAVVEVKGREAIHMELRQVDGQWKIAVSKLLAGRDAKKVQQDLGTMKGMTLAAHQTADEIQAGKYANAEQALQAFQEKLKGLVKPQDRK